MHCHVVMSPVIRVTTQWLKQPIGFFFWCEVVRKFQTYNSAMLQLYCKNKTRKTVSGYFLLKCINRHTWAGRKENGFQHANVVYQGHRKEWIHFQLIACNYHTTKRESKDSWSATFVWKRELSRCC